MSTQRDLFYKHVGQTSPMPLGLEIERAEGIYLFDIEGKSYIDLISGVSVSNVGHRHPKVLEAIRVQLDQYLHLMVYGEYIQAPQVRLASLLAEHLPAQLQSVYFVNSGSEAIEGAMKLAKRFTGRSNMVSFKGAYHGSTHGALSLMGGEDYRFAFRPLLPGIEQIEFGEEEQLEKINQGTACVVLDPIHSEAGIKEEEDEYLAKLRRRCTEVGALLIFDEVQTGFGRTGSLFYFEQTVVPDILVLAKAMGGGMPIGAFISSQEKMQCFTLRPALGHITTFGGHPVSCAAALASLQLIVEENLHIQSEAKGRYMHSKLVSHKQMRQIRRKGLFLACDLISEKAYERLLQLALERGLIIDSFLFKPNSFRIAPPLTIRYEEMDQAMDRLLECLDRLTDEGF